jgi:hypothetical protein
MVPIEAARERQLIAEAERAAGLTRPEIVFAGESPTPEPPRESPKRKILREQVEKLRRKGLIVRRV